jgi:hypothetical protein
MLQARNFETSMENRYRNDVFAANPAAVWAMDWPKTTQDWVLWVNDTRRF